MHTQDQFCLQWVGPYIEKKSVVSLFSSPFFSKFTFFDVGSNIGDYVSTIKQKYSDAEIHCFEPNVHELLKNNTRRYSNLVINPCAVGDFNGKTKIYAPDKATALGSMIKRPVFTTGCADSTILEIETSIITIDKYIKEKRIQCIDYLKVDVEGKELDVLKGASKSLEKKVVKCGQFEYGSTFQDSGITLKEVVEYLNGKGYSVFEGPIATENEITTQNVVEDYRWENLLFVNKELL